MGQKIFMPTMFRIILVFLFPVLLSGCEESHFLKTPEMEAEARNTVLKYLANNQMPSEGLSPNILEVKPSSEFDYLYTGGGRCIGFKIICYGQSCKELLKYPYDIHGEKCP
jgi:hypothetical protein